MAKITSLKTTCMFKAVYKGMSLNLTVTKAADKPTSTKVTVKDPSDHFSTNPTIIYKPATNCIEYNAGRSYAGQSGWFQEDNHKLKSITNKNLTRWLNSLLKELAV